eukprot:1435626-Prymnesium_polylepis.1
MPFSYVAADAQPVPPRQRRREAAVANRGEAGGRVGVEEDAVLEGAADWGARERRRRKEEK